jgi:aminopeptidase N
VNVSRDYDLCWPAQLRRRAELAYGSCASNFRKVRGCTPRMAWFTVCAMLAACSRPQGPTSCEPTRPDTILQAHMVREGVARAGCAGAAAITVLDHRADIGVHLSPPALGGHGEVRVRALEPASAVQLDSMGLQISSARSGGNQLRFSQEYDSTCFELSQPLAAGEELTLALAWQADPVARGLTFASDQAWASYLTPAWLPTKLDVAQRATLKLTLTVSEDLVLVASSHTDIAARFGDGLRHVTYEVKTPTSPFLYGFALGQFETSNYSLPGVAHLSAFGPRRPDLENVQQLTMLMYQFLRTRTGAAPAFGYYTQVFVRGKAVHDGLGMSLISEDVLRDLRADPTDDGVIAHALAHQWFGVLIPCADSADLWLNESFATLMVAAINEQRWGRAAYDRELAIWRDRSKKVHESGCDTPLSLWRPQQARASAVTEAKLKARGDIYLRGALVLDKLRRELGEEVFWNGIRRYVAEQAGKPTRSADLQHAMATASGRDLTAFFERWVYAIAADP